MMDWLDEPMPMLSGLGETDLLLDADASTFDGGGEGATAPDSLYLLTEDLAPGTPSSGSGHVMVLPDDDLWLFGGGLASGNEEDQVGDEVIVVGKKGRSADEDGGGSGDTGTVGFGGPGGTGGSGGGGEGGGRGGVDTGPVSVVVDIDPATNQASVAVTASTASGSFTADFDVNNFDLKSLTMNINTDFGVYTGTVTLNNGMFNQSYMFSLGNIGTGTLSFGTNGTNYSVGATLTVRR